MSSTTTASALFARAVANDEADLEALLDAAGPARHAGSGDRPARLDRPARDRRRRAPGDPGGVRARPGDAPRRGPVPGRGQDRPARRVRDRRHRPDPPQQVHWLDAGSDELLDQLRVLNGFDIDLAADLTRLTNRLRDSLTSDLAGTGAGRRLAAAPGRRPRPARQVPDADRAARRRAGPGSSTTIKTRSPRHRGQGHRRRHGRARRPDRDHARRGRHRPGHRRARRRARTASPPAATPSPPRSRRPSSPTLSASSSARCPGIGPRTGARILAEIGDGTALRQRLASSPPTPDSPRSPASPAPSSSGESKSRRGNHRLKNAMFLAAFASLRPRRPRPSTTANEPRARSTTPPSSASPAAAATSSSPCSAPASPTGRNDRNRPGTACRSQPDISPPSHLSRLDKHHGTPPRGLLVGGCLEAQGWYAGDAELDVDGRAWDRSRARAALQETARGDRPVQRMPGTDHGCVAGAGDRAGADGTTEAAGAGGRIVAASVCGTGIEGDRRAADGAQREVDGCELIAGGARPDLAGEAQAGVAGPWRLDRLAWRAGDAVDRASKFRRWACRPAVARAAGRAVRLRGRGEEGCRSCGRQRRSRNRARQIPRSRRRR